MRSSKVERWLEGKETPLLLQGLTMGATLGVGSFGEVRVGTLPSGEHCAVKVMDPRKLSGTSLSEMRNEVNALAKLRHRNVIRYYGMVADGSCTSRWCNDEYCGCLEFEADDDGCCSKCGHAEKCHAAYPEKRSAVAIVQELAAGGDLVSLLFTSSLGYRMDDIIPRTYLHQLLDGIEYCHSQKICHGDIKPENLCLNSSAMLKIVDFGLCHELGSSTRGGGGSGMAVGGSSRGSGGGSGWSSCGSGGGGSHVHSGCYTAPEIHAKKAEFDRQAADVWSCGVVLYMMIAREVPFEYSDGVAPAAMRDGTFPWPATMDEELRSLIAHMLDPNPESRWTIEQIKQHAWYRQPIMTQADLSLRMADHMQNSWVEQKKHELVKLLQSPKHTHRPGATSPTGEPGAGTGGSGRHIHPHPDAGAASHGVAAIPASSPALAPAPAPALQPNANAALDPVGAQPFRLPAAEMTPAAAQTVGGPSQIIRHLSFGAAGVRNSGAREGDGSDGTGRGAPRHQYLNQQPAIVDPAELRLVPNLLPDLGPDDLSGDGGGEAEPETETETESQAHVQTHTAPLIGTPRTSKASRSCFDDAATIRLPSTRTGATAGPGHPINAYAVGSDQHQLQEAQRNARGHGFRAPSLPVPVSVPAAATVEIGGLGPTELGELKSASAPTSSLSAAVLLSGDSAPPLSLPEQHLHSAYRNGSSRSSTAVGHWDLDESSDSDNEIAEETLTPRYHRQGSFADERIDRPHNSAPEEEYLPLIRKEPHSKPLPMEGAGEAADGEPESDGMDPMTVGMQMPPVGARAPPTAATGALSELFSDRNGAVSASSGRSDVAPATSTTSSSSMVTNRNSKRTHSKTKETTRDSSSAHHSVNGGRRPKSKRTHSQTRIADDAARIGTQAGRNSDSRGHIHWRSGSTAETKTAANDSSSGADAGSVPAANIEGRAAVVTPEPDQDADRYKARKKASWHGSQGDAIRVVPNPAAEADGSGSAAVGASLRARGSDGPAGVAVHTYISLPGDVTKNQAVEMLTSSLKDMVIDASISRTNSGDVIIRHSSSSSTIATEAIASNRESTGNGAFLHAPFAGSPLPTTPESETASGADSTVQMHGNGQERDHEQEDVAMGTTAAMGGMSVSGRPTSHGSPAACSPSSGWTAGLGTGLITNTAVERAPEREALMKAQVYERPAEAGGGAVIAVQRLRGAVLPHLQQFARIKEHVERAATRSGLTPPGNRPADPEPLRVRATEPGSDNGRYTPTAFPPGHVPVDDSGATIGTVDAAVDVRDTSTSVAHLSEQVAAEAQNAGSDDEDMRLSSATTAAGSGHRGLRGSGETELEAEVDAVVVACANGAVTERTAATQDEADTHDKADAGACGGDPDSSRIAWNGASDRVDHLAGVSSINGSNRAIAAAATTTTAGAGDGCTHKEIDEDAEVQNKTETVAADQHSTGTASADVGEAVKSCGDLFNPQQQQRHRSVVDLHERTGNDSDSTSIRAGTRATAPILTMTVSSGGAGGDSARTNAEPDELLRANVGPMAITTAPVTDADTDKASRLRAVPQSQAKPSETVFLSSLASSGSRRIRADGNSNDNPRNTGAVPALAGASVAKSVAVVGEKAGGERGVRLGEEEAKVKPEATESVVVQEEVKAQEGPRKYSEKQREGDHEKEQERVKHQRDRDPGKNRTDHDSTDSVTERNSGCHVEMVGQNKEEKPADSFEGERRRRRRRRNSGPSGKQSSADDRDELATVTGASLTSGHTGHFAALDLNLSAPDCVDDASGSNLSSSGGGGKGVSSAASTRPRPRPTGVSARTRSSEPFAETECAKAASSPGSSIRRLPSTGQAQLASINVVGEKRTPAEVGLWDRRHQRASSEEPEDMEPGSNYYGSLVTCAREYDGMHDLDGGELDSIRGAEATAGAVAIPRHHRHVRARLSVEPSATSSSGQRHGRSQLESRTDRIGRDPEQSPEQQHEVEQHRQPIQ